MKTKKIINDPIYGFIKIPEGLVFNILEHPYFQRLRRIKQLGLTDYVYPGAIHTRFHHALGAMHLMDIALQNLRLKGIAISDTEFEASLIAILLHDIGHGPFSHALEFSLLNGIRHEDLSSVIIRQFNKEFNGKLQMAVEIFNNDYPRKFFNQLVASQSDVDRLDYLNRDSFFTGVSEGKIGFERIIKMLNVVNDQIVVEEKAMYSIENFLSARRLMYWQVYLHKTTVGAEKLLIQLIKRAKFLAKRGELKTRNDALKLFLNEDVKISDFIKDERYLHSFLLLDDHDIWGSVKIWQFHEDKVLSQISKMFINRDLFKVVISNTPNAQEKVEGLIGQVADQMKLTPEEASFFIISGELSNAAYDTSDTNINLLMKSGDIVDIAVASDLPSIKAMSKIVKKFYLCSPKIVSL